MLEVGCGAGFSAAYLAGYYGAYVGIDYAEPFIAYTRQHQQGPGVTFEVSNGKTYRSSRRFDVVFMIGVLHHIDNLAETLPAMLTLLKPGGWLVANEPHPGNPLIRLARVIRKRLDPHYASDQQEFPPPICIASTAVPGWSIFALCPRVSCQRRLPRSFCSHRPSCRDWQRWPVPLMPGWNAAWDGGSTFTWNVIAAGRKPQ